MMRTRKSICRMPRSIKSICMMSRITKSIGMMTRKIKTICIMMRTTQTVCIMPKTIKLMTRIINSICMMNRTLRSICMMTITMRSICMMNRTIKSICIVTYVQLSNKNNSTGVVVIFHFSMWTQLVWYLINDGDCAQTINSHFWFTANSTYSQVLTISTHGHKWTVNCNYTVHHYWNVHHI